MYHILYNPLSAASSGKEKVHALKSRLPEAAVYADVTQIADLHTYLQKIPPEDHVVVAGGDGTVHHLVNQLDGCPVSREILYYPIGSGNDFAADIGEKPENRLIPFNRYMEGLPTVDVNGQKRRFLNCAGNGFDGYCCAEGARLRKLTQKSVNYTAIALKGLLKIHKPCRARITVDGAVHDYEKVWLAPTMNGRYFGGGMMMAPDQDRMNPEKKLSIVVVHDCSKWKMLFVFPLIFLGKHMKFTQLIDLYTGNEITVEYETPSALQIDGEIVTGIKVCHCVSGEK